MESTRLFNKLEIRMYSTLISLMSGIKRFKSIDMLDADVVILPGARAQVEASPVMTEALQKPASLRWQTIQQALLSVLLWTLLGFAAGFLLGMIKGG
jgi:hypothetical protein